MDKKPAPDARPQVEKFRDLARKLECDDDEAAFDGRLKKLATAPPQHRPKKGDRGKWLSP